MNAPRFDRRHQPVTVRQRAARAQVELADGVARAIRRAPARRLEQLTRGPARRVILGGIFWQMPQHYDRTGADGVNAAIRWEITGRSDGRLDIYHLEIAGAGCRVSRGPAGPEPRLTITLDAAELLRLATGNSQPVQAYLRGRIKLSGDVMLAATLMSLFRIPGTRTKTPES